MNYLYDFYQCIMLSNRKKEKNLDSIEIYKKTMNLEKFDEIKECSWLGCGLDLNKEDESIIMAKIRNKYYIPSPRFWVVCIIIASIQESCR